ncbi:Vasohibin-2 [Tetrabaena socialis]|uniref:Vasohibin-2 n=1 Tax=Tetrabaena socialis TaxID=47790 RepID=A0A2J7ZYF7_9CHLO|nr:Vasohibin-2 [Tetrabaena socialis]|eukprot:PNH05301.1 Vasohibin-2 [Tetrabaena socialis]
MHECKPADKRCERCVCGANTSKGDMCAHAAAGVLGPSTSATMVAVFLGTLLTAGWADVDRLPLAFKSTVQGQTYRHIVLLVHHVPTRKWGALGLSRRPELMDKDLVYDSLADVVSDYKASYERWWHRLAKVRLPGYAGVYVGLPLEHDTYYAGPVCWRYLTLSLTGRKPWQAHRSALDSFEAHARRLAAKFRALGTRPPADGSLGGAEQQQQPQAGGGGDAGGGVVAAARCAKSVSPSRRRTSLQQQPPPLPRRPLTPLRLRTAVSTAAAATDSAAAGAASSAPGPAAPAQGPPQTVVPPSAQPEEQLVPGKGGGSTGCSSSTGGSSGGAVGSSSGAVDSSSGAVGSSGATTSSAAVRGGGGAAGDGDGAAPGGGTSTGAAALATARARAKPGPKAQARMLRQRIKAEEAGAGSGAAGADEGGGAGGARGGGAAWQAGDEGEGEDEDSESEEEEYLGPEAEGGGDGGEETG